MFTDLFQLEQKPVTVFSSGDAGAPVLLKEPGSLKTLLKACLVTGYGDKASLGWAMKFESEDQKSAAFASTDVTASQFVFKIDDSSSTTAKLSAYQSMASIDVGQNPFGVDNEYTLYASDWRLVGHSKAFILLLDVDMKGFRCALPIVFGDIPCEVKRVEAACILWSARVGGYGTGGLQSTLAKWPNGHNSGYSNMDKAVCYPVRMSSEGNGFNINQGLCRFSYTDYVNASALYEPVLMSLADSAWGMLPMLLPLSSRLIEVANLGQINANAINARTGHYDYFGFDNNDCAVPTNWWYA